MSKGTKERAAAKRVVQQQLAAERRRAVTLWTSVAVVAVLLIAGLIGWGVLAGQQNDNADNLTVPAGAVDDGTAFPVGSGPVNVDVYEDFMCPICHEFEQQSGDTLKQLAADDKATIRYHPIAILDRASNGTQYSTRASAASAAAFVGGKFTEYHDVLYANQPEEGSNGLDNAKLIELGKSVGLTDAKFADAINNKTYWAWATKATDTASERSVSSTPTVMINGKKVSEANGAPPTPATLTTAVASAAG
ncbi:DsbA family protein [Mangrovihabitans endophyticus]|uniref:Membrane protein n=1 Tax=Mangrovihabitans endophyticus TaxID=1751298 RepID=A0A8J3FNH9_9ACTN|nr:thioredoxin domain-containing protein [Mangrovihabitans endophyticus]GGK87375.1 membrane protein [Mangrovihabitans endophyticus]